MSDEVLVRVDQVSKKFCRDLKKSLWYGIQDITSEIMGSKYDRQLRQDEFWSVNDVSFELRRGECLGLIGPNGAGKSTLLKMLNGLIKPDKGRIEIRGRVGALIELGAGFNPILTGRENIYANGSILGFTIAEIEKKLDAIVEFSELEEFIDTPVQNYSSGMRVRLGFAVAAQMEPDVLIIDEVLAVGDVGFRAKCFNAIYKMIKNAAVIMVTHQMPQISRVCTDVLVMNRGKCDYQGKNVGEAIDVFYSYFAGEEQGIITGSRRATIHYLELEINGVRGVESINYLDELILNLEVTVVPEVQFFDIGVLILSQELQHVIQYHSKVNHYQINNLHNYGQKMQITANLGKINLNPGIYSLEIYIQSENRGEVMIKHHNIKQFKVGGDFVGHAPVLNPSEWIVKVQEENQVIIN